MAFNSHQMRSLACTVREGSISGAARRLGVSQSAVSQHIAKLEAAIGAPLLIRARDGVQLTQAGHEIFTLADELTALEQQIEERLRGHAGLDRGHLTIIANAPQPALGLISRYTKRFPKISVDFALMDWAAAMERVAAKQVDIAVITDPTPQKDLYIRPIKRARYVLYTLPDHVLARQDAISLSDICQETLLLPEEGSLTRRTVQKALARAKLTPSRIVTMTTFPVMKEGILQRIGVGIFLAESSASKGDLSETPIAELSQEFTTSIVIPKYKVGLRITQSFLELAGDPAEQPYSALHLA